jgi:hypothetical protein
MRLALTYLTRTELNPSCYVRSTFGGNDFLPGLSDVDVVIVLAEDPAGGGVARERVTRRWQRLRNALPATDLFLCYPRIYEGADLDDVNGASALTYGLDARNGSRGCYFGARASPGRARTLERPGLYGVSGDWQLLSGPDRRPRETARDAQLRRIAGWLELTCWWQYLFPVCADSSGPRTAALCVKLIAEPARIWLWLAHGERVPDRAEALDRALRWLPEEEEALRRALALHRSLPASPEPPLAEVVPALIRLSARIAALIAAQIAEDGVTEVRLVGAEPAELLHPGRGWRVDGSLAGGRNPEALPLCDWRALVLPRVPDESFVPLPGHAADPAILGLAASGHDVGPYAAFRAADLLILPALRFARTRLRAVKSPATDPVSFALADGAQVARFPNARGWSARDSASRAVAEHSSWLRSGPGPLVRDDPLDRPVLALAMLLSAGRAALFLKSLDDGAPELPLTITETVRRLGSRSHADAAVADDALERYRDFVAHRTPPPAATLEALRRLVSALPAYARPNERPRMVSGLGST